MKLIILSPNLHLIFSEEQKSQLDSEFDVEYFTQPESIDSISVLHSDDEKIVAIDPDFCDWKVTRGNLEKMKNVKAISLATTSFHYINTCHVQQHCFTFLEKWNTLIGSGRVPLGTLFVPDSKGNFC